MLSLEEMILRLIAAIILGAVIGLEREISGKEAGIRTDIVVAAGAAIFAIAGLTLPYLIALNPENLAEILARNSGFLTVIANVVIGIGFLGAGIIVKHGVHVRGLTTAATVWYVAAVGVLCGIGLIKFAVIAALGTVLILAVLRKIDLYKLLGKEEHDHLRTDIEEEQDKRE